MNFQIYVITVDGNQVGQDDTYSMAFDTVNDILDKDIEMEIGTISIQTFIVDDTTGIRNLMVSREVYNKDW